ncbi:MAG TPA: hypothetical protein VI111_01065 [Thermoleophilaceae bacterium]
MPAVRLLAMPVAALLVLALTAQGGGGAGAPGPDDPCPTAYPGDGADKARIARWMARGAALRGLPDELPAMAALAETGVANIRSPDQRYVGYFQMDVKGWNRGSYRGYPRDPDLQLQWFTDYAVLARQQRIAEGDATVGQDPARWGRWVGIVENPGAPAVAHYQHRLDEARALVAGDCLPTGTTPDSTPPSLRIRAARSQQGAIAVRTRCPSEDCVAGAVATTAGGKGRGRTPALQLHAGATTTLVLRPRGKPATLRVQVTAVDEAGNAARAARRVTFSR